MKVLQGTDGVRGRTCANKSLLEKDSVELFVTQGIITPKFVFRYVKGYCEYLRETSLAEEGGSVVIGWDPRDREGVFAGAAINAINESGLSPVIAGCLPTPAIALYMIGCSASGTVVITASHNPPDYNGIKLFLPKYALKPYPVDDEKISKHVFNQDDPPVKKVFATYQDPFYINPSAMEYYVRNITDAKNSWIQLSKAFAPELLIVVDTAHGAMSTVIDHVLGKIQGMEMIHVNNGFDKEINSNGGVVTIEDCSEISLNDFMSGKNRYCSHNGLKKMFELMNEPGVVSGRQFLAGVSFDGDGDRFLFYYAIPSEKCIRIFNGDEFSLLISTYMLKYTSPENIHFVNTIESNLSNTDQVNSQGINYYLTGVGDKWVTWKTWQVLHGFINGDLPGGSLKQPFQPGYVLIRENMDATISQVSSRKLENLKNDIKTKKIAIFGTEPSGHLVSPVLLSGPGEKEKLVFCGDGLKGFLNTLVAWYPKSAKISSSLYEIKQKTTGLVLSKYCYYVEKNCLKQGNPIRGKLEKIIEDELKRVFGKYCQVEKSEFVEEPDLIYYHVREMVDEKPVGSLYVRNSGTEPKTGAHVRGWNDSREKWHEIMERLHLFLMVHLKSRENPFVRAQLKLLQLSDEHPIPLHELKYDFPDLPWERILHETSYFEGLVVKKKSGWYPTENGKKWLNLFSAKERREQC